MFQTTCNNPRMNPTQLSQVMFMSVAQVHASTSPCSKIHGLSAHVQLIWNDLDYIYIYIYAIYIY